MNYTGKTTGFITTEHEFNEAEIIIQYSSDGNLGTLTIGDGKTIQFSVSSRVVEQIISEGKKTIDKIMLGN